VGAAQPDTRRELVVMNKDFTEKSKDWIATAGKT